MDDDAELPCEAITLKRKSSERDGMRTKGNPTLVQLEVQNHDLAR